MAPEPSPTPSWPSSAKTIRLNARTNQDWSGKFIDETYIDLLIEDETRVLKPDGSLLVQLRKNVLPRELVASAWSELRDVNMTTSNRGTASGVKAKPRVRADGSLSNTTEVNKMHKIMSYVIGYMERNPRFPWCRACAWNMHNPEKFAKVIPLARKIDRLFAESVPDRYAAQKAVVEKSSKDFLIADTAFSTITVNKNFRTACHKDAGDLEAGFGVITCIREGKFSGGTLVLPDFRVGVKFDTFDVLFFDVHEWHGNTKIMPLSEKFQRCTMVFYFREMIQHCKSAKEEHERVKSRKLGEPMFELNGQ